MGSRPSFRPRPIDSSRPLPIVRSSKDLRHEDDVVVSRALPSVGTGVEAAELEERHLQQALMASVYGNDAQKKADIPIPVVHSIEPPPTGQTEPFSRPRNMYIMFDRSDADLEDTLIDYDADFVDEAFVKTYTQTHKKAPPLSLDHLERAFDLLEKLQGRSCLENAAVEATGSKDDDDKKPSTQPKSAEEYLSFADTRQELADLLPSLSEFARKELYKHWFARRLKRKAPFHRLYIPPPDAEDPDPSVAFRPRGREDGVHAGRRMNTYENYKRAKLLREEFESLRRTMAEVVKRERYKAEYVAVKSLQVRSQCVVDGGSRLSSISRSVVAADREGYCLGSGESRIAISCRGIGPELPGEIEAAMRRIPFGPDKNSRPRVKKKKVVLSGTEKSGARSTGGPNAGSVSGVGRDGRYDDREPRAQVATPAIQQQGVDMFGFDDHGNKFLKQMRYFAGGFMNYGVCPYDHRVFAAASERNTVKELPSEPRSFMFPGKRVRVGRNGGTAGGKRRPSAGLGHDAASEEPPSASFGLGVSRRKRRSIKVRARVGRGGRVILDRVIFEPERGVKAASYPASVEMGGVYTAGLPLEEAAQVAQEHGRWGALGDITAIGDASALSDTQRRIMQPLQPMVSHARGRVDSDGRVVYWPSRAQAAADSTATWPRRTLSGYAAAPSMEGVSSETEERDADADTDTDAGVSAQHATRTRVLHTTEEELRALPAYASVERPLVESID